MHHFFDNATKYSRSNDEVNFIFSAQNELVVKMHSLVMENTNKIFIRGFSGENAENLAGDGIGMYVIKEGLSIMNMDISVESNSVLNNDKSYSKNTFAIKCNT